tara:strand:+ start:456 stop:1169 length:714 start_codon:yes stop_codon:yes gene_type:complete
MPQIPVSQSYHEFSDTRPCLGIPNFGDVISNFPFALFGILGVITVIKMSGGKIFLKHYHCWPYLIFFCAVILVSLGSSYYHLNPSNGRLYLDRAPILLGFICLFAAFFADRVNQQIGIFLLFPSLLTLGCAAFLWDFSQLHLGGDLRFYALLQIYTFVALPLICWFFPNNYYTGNRHLYMILSWYAVAKVCEVYDQTIFESLAGLISGHTLKHFVASIAVFVVIGMLRRAQRSLPIN